MRLLSALLLVALAASGCTTPTDRSADAPAGFLLAVATARSDDPQDDHLRDIPAGAPMLAGFVRVSVWPDGAGAHEGGHDVAYDPGCVPVAGSRVMDCAGQPVRDAYTVPPATLQAGGAFYPVDARGTLRLRVFDPSLVVLGAHGEPRAGYPDAGPEGGPAEYVTWTIAVDGGAATARPLAGQVRVQGEAAVTFGYQVDAWP